MVTLNYHLNNTNLECWFVILCLQLEDTVRGSLKESVTHKYGIPSKLSITRQWDKIQKSVSHQYLMKLCYKLNYW